MAVLPDRVEERIAWFEQRIAAWTASAELIGLQDTQVAQLTPLITAARAAFNAAQAARTAAKNATFTQSNAVRELSAFGGDLIKTIKAFAESSGNPQVYTIASVPAPAPPSPAGPPKAPENVAADPNADGSITIRWAGSMANQTFFTVWRKLGSTGTYTQIGAVASKSFIDTQVPAGLASVSYLVRAQRNNIVSPASDVSTVQFGGGAQGLAA